MYAVVVLHEPPIPRDRVAKGGITHTLCEGRRPASLERGKTRERVGSERVTVLIAVIVRPGDAEASGDLVQLPRRELELFFDFKGSRPLAPALLRTTAGERVNDSDRSLVASGECLSAIPLAADSKIIYVEALEGGVMSDVKFRGRSFVRERTLRQIEFANSLIARSAVFPRRSTRIACVGVK
jgi:hypothetical protein